MQPSYVGGRGQPAGLGKEGERHGTARQGAIRVVSEGILGYICLSQRINTNVIATWGARPVEHRDAAPGGF